MTSLSDALAGVFDLCGVTMAGGSQRDPVAAAMPYADYLRTEHWQDTRHRALQRAGFQCKRCEINGVQLDVHHLTYDRLGREAERDLIVLCNRCHAREHGDTAARCPSCMRERIGSGRCWYCGTANDDRSAA